MAGNPAIVVRIAANVREFLAGTDKVEDALDDLAKESGSTADDLGRDTERMERAFRDAARDIDKSSRKAERSVREGFSDPVKEQGAEAGREVGSEFASNLGESLASGDLTGLSRDTAAGLVSGFAGIGGPIGVALAGVAATAAGLFAGITAKAQASKERIDELYGSLIDGEAAASEALKDSQARAFLESLGDSATEVLAAYEAIGVSLPDVAAALAGDESARERVAAATERATDKLFEQERAVTDSTGALDLATVAGGLYAQATSTVSSESEIATQRVLANRDAYGKLNTELDKAIEKSRIYYRLVGKAPPVPVNSAGIPTTIARPGGGRRTP